MNTIVSLSLLILSIAATCTSAQNSTNFGQLLLAYYSGVGEDTLGSGGVNAIAMAFFDPTPLGNGNCDFTDANTPCIVPASGAGSSLNLGWALSVFSTVTSQLSANTSPNRGGKPTIYFSFGGASQGGACWDSLFGDSGRATTFGQTAAQLVTTVYQKIGQSAYVGFDLDVEGTSTNLPHLPDFVNAFRKGAPYDTYPLQLCALSGLANSDNSDHFKIPILQQVGPAQQGITFLNMMVANEDESCTAMSQYWQDPSLNFIPATNRILGVWGELYASWMLHGPGCTDGNNPMFPWIQSNEIGIGIWQWWTGPTSDILALINQIRSGNGGNTGTVTSGTSATSATSGTGTGTSGTSGTSATATSGTSGGGGCTGKAAGMYCTDSTHFEWCPQGITQSCGAGTTCVQQGTSVECA